MTSQCNDSHVTNSHMTCKGSWEMTALSPREYVNEEVSSLVVTLCFLFDLGVLSLGFFFLLCLGGFLLDLSLDLPFFFFCFATSFSSFVKAFFFSSSFEVKVFVLLFWVFYVISTLLQHYFCLCFWVPLSLSSPWWCFHEFHETCRSFTFMVLVNSHQR